jgi:hypothetical protein
MNHKIEGAGGSKGGFKQFFGGIFMMGTGFYMLLSKIMVTSSMGGGMGRSLYRMSNIGGSSMNMNLTTGMIFIPMIIGIMWIFYNAKSVWGWAIAGTSMGAMIFGVLASLRISMQTIPSFDLITMLVLGFGGIGLFLSSLRKFDA